MFVAQFICFDSCPTPERFASSGFVLVPVMIPCVALELLALATFVPHAIVTGEARRAVRQAAAFLLGGLGGVAVVGAFVLMWRAGLPLTSGSAFDEGSMEAWATLWAVVLLIVAVTWSGILAYLEWGR